MQEDTEQELSCLPDGTEQTICCLPEGTAQHACRNKKYTFTLTELRELVTSAQHGNRQAIEQLCTSFKPLIYKEAYRCGIRGALGEDSVNTAWLIFLEQIKKYDGHDYGHLPGLLQYHIHFGLMQKITRSKSVKESVFLDDEEDDNCFQLADEKNDIDQMVNNQLLANAMKQLSDAQRNIIQDVFLKDQSMQSCSKKYGITKQTCFVHKERALEKLKQALTA